MCVSNAYAGLMTGITVGAAIPSTIFSIFLLNQLLKRWFPDTSLREHNIVHTIASAGESVAAGAVFTLPALVILGISDEFHFTTTFFLILCGSLFGLLLAIPMRRLLVADEKLDYPEAIACKAILESAQNSRQSNANLVVAIFIGYTVKLLATFNLLINNLVSPFSKPDYPQLSIEPSPLLIGVGWIVGIKFAFQLFVGGTISHGILEPLFVSILGFETENAFKYLGVGAIVVAAMSTLFRVVLEFVSKFRREPSSETTSQNSGASIAWAALFLLVSIGLFAKLEFNYLATALFGLCVIFLVPVAAYIVGIYGSTNNPVSGFILASVILAVTVFVFFDDMSDSKTIVVFIATGVACATSVAGDLSQDFKIGSLVSASDYKIVIAKFIGICFVSCLLPLLMNVMNEGLDFKSSRLLVPHPYVVKNVVEIGESAEQSLKRQPLKEPVKKEVGAGEISPQDLLLFFGLGAGTASLFLLFNNRHLVTKRQSRNANVPNQFRFSILAIALGMYLPWWIAITCLIGGCFSAYTIKKEDGEGMSRHTTSFVAGIISGEALAALTIAALVTFQVVTQENLNEFDKPASNIPLAIGALVAIATIFFASSAFRSGGQLKS